MPLGTNLNSYCTVDADLGMKPLPGRSRLCLLTYLLVLGVNVAAGKLASSSSLTKAAARPATTGRVAASVGRRGGASTSSAVHGHDDESHGMSIGTLAVNIMADLCPHGMLPLAYGMAAEGGTGLIPALALLATFGTLSAYTLVSIGRACERTRSYSFRGLWSQLIHPKTAWVIDAGVTLLGFGCCIFYAAFIGDLFSALAQALGAPDVLHKRWVCLVALHAFPLLPLCLMRNLSGLQYSSYVGALGIVYTAIFVVLRSLDGSYGPGGKYHSMIEAAYRPVKQHEGLKALFHVGPGAVSLMNMACVAFTTHYNGINYYNELQNRTVSRYTTAVSLGFLASFTVFALMMSFGHRTFGAAAQPLLLNNYHKIADPLATGARLATGFSILCGFPLMFAGLKTGFFSLYRNSIERSSTLPPSTKRVLLSEGAAAALSTALVSAICAVACECTEEDVGFVIGIIGAVLGTGVVYIIPALLNSSLLRWRAKARGERSVNQAVIAAGTVFAVLGTMAALEEHYPHLLHNLPKLLKTATA